jgi:hypothetical protein
MGWIALAELEKAKVDCEWLDISDLSLPFDEGTCPPQPGSPLQFSSGEAHAFQVLRALLQKTAS